MSTEDDAERIARNFHETFQCLTATSPSDIVPWSAVPIEKRVHVLAALRHMIGCGVIVAGPLPLWRLRIGDEWRDVSTVSSDGASFGAWIRTDGPDATGHGPTMERAVQELARIERATAIRRPDGVVMGVDGDRPHHTGFYFPTDGYVTFLLCGVPVSVHKRIADHGAVSLAFRVVASQEGDPMANASTEREKIQHIAQRMVDAGVIGPAEP